MTTTDLDTVSERGDAAARQRRLAQAVRSLRTRATDADTARLLLTFGGILVPLGFVLVILGWYGAAHTTDVFAQIPYSISGGMLGMALVFAGGFCYFAYWLTQLVFTTRRNTSDTVALLEDVKLVLQRIEGHLEAQTGTTSPSTRTPAAGRTRRARRT